MTDRDNSSKGFLERWSRKKIEGEREASDPSAGAARDGCVGCPMNRVRLSVLRRTL